MRGRARARVALDREGDLDRADGDLAARQQQEGLALVLEERPRRGHDLRRDIGDLRERHDARRTRLGCALRQRGVVREQLLRHGRTPPDTQLGTRKPEGPWLQCHCTAAVPG